jgi:hypothetical protein
MEYETVTKHLFGNVVLAALRPGRKYGLIYSRKRFLEAHKNELEEIFVVMYSTISCLEDCSYPPSPPFL